MRTPLPLLSAFALLALSGCHRHPAGIPYVDHAWVRLAAVPGRPAAAYLTIHGGAEATRLVAVETKAAGSSELHEMLNRSGPGGGPSQMTMDRVDGVDVPANTAVTLAPEDYHVMLFGLSADVKAGGRLPLSVRLAKGDPILVEAKVIAAGDDAPY